MPRRSARLALKKQAVESKWLKWFAEQRWMKEKQNTPERCPDSPCPVSGPLTFTNSPKGHNKIYHSIEKSSVERTVQHSPEQYEDTYSLRTTGTLSSTLTPYTSSVQSELTGLVNWQKWKKPLGCNYVPLPGTCSNTASPMQQDRTHLQNLDLAHQKQRYPYWSSEQHKQPSPESFGESYPVEGRDTPKHSGRSPGSWSPGVNGAGSRTPVVLVQKLPKFCQLGSPVSVTSLSRMNSPAQSFGHADIPATAACVEKSREADGLIPPVDSFERNYLYSETSSIINQHYHMETSASGEKDNTFKTQVYNSALTGCLLLSSLELAENDGIDDRCFDSMMEACAQMTEVRQRDEAASSERSLEDVSHRNLTHSQTAHGPCSSTHVMDLDSQAEREAAVEGLMSLNQTGSADVPVSVGSCQESVCDSMRTEPLVSAAGTAAKKDTATRRQGRKKKSERHPQKAPTVKSTGCGRGRKSSKDKVTTKKTRKDGVNSKTLMKGETLKKKQKNYKCSYCSFRTKDKRGRKDHVAACHPYGCPCCRQRFSNPEVFNAHKTICAMETYPQCFACEKKFHKNHRKHHFHSSGHQRIVCLLRNSARYMRRHGNIRGFLSSLTCDVSLGCETCHPTSLDLEQDNEGGVSENQTQTLNDTSVSPHLQGTVTGEPGHQHSGLAPSPGNTSFDSDPFLFCPESLQEPERPCGLEAEIAHSSGGMLPERALIPCRSETVSSPLTATDSFCRDISSSCHSHRLSDVSIRNMLGLENNTSSVKQGMSNVEILDVANPAPALNSTAAVSGSVSRSVVPNAQNDSGNTFTDLIDFLEDCDLSVVGMEDDSGVDLDVLNAENCCNSAAVRYGQNVSEQGFVLSDVCIVSSKELSNATDTTDGGILSNHTAKLLALSNSADLSDRIEKKNSRTLPRTNQEVPCQTYVQSHVSTNSSVNTNISTRESQHGTFHMSTSHIDSSCKTVNSADYILFEVLEDCSTVYQVSSNDLLTTCLSEKLDSQTNPDDDVVIKEEFNLFADDMENNLVAARDVSNAENWCDSSAVRYGQNVTYKGSALTDRFVIDVSGDSSTEDQINEDDLLSACFPECSGRNYGRLPVVTSETIPEPGSFEGQTKPNEAAAIKPPAIQHAVGNSVDNLAAVKPRTVPQMTKTGTQEKDRARVSALSVASLTPPLWSLASVTTPAGVVEGCADSRSNTRSENVDRSNLGQMSGPSMVKRTTGITPSYKHTVCTSHNHTERALGDREPGGAENNTTNKQKSLQQLHAADRGQMNVQPSTERKSRKRARVTTPNQRSPKRQKIKQTGMITETDLSVVKPRKATAPKDKQTAGTHVQTRTVNTGSKQSAESTRTAKQATQNSCLGKQRTLKPSTPEQGTVKNTTPKHSGMSTSKPKHPEVSTKQPAVSTSTSKPEVSTSAPKQPGMSTSKSSQPIVSTSKPKQPVTTMSALSQPVGSTFTPKQPVVSTYTPKPEVSTSTPKQSEVRTSTPKQPRLSTSTTSQQALNSSPNQTKEKASKTAQGTFAPKQRPPSSSKAKTVFVSADDVLKELMNMVSVKEGVESRLTVKTKSLISTKAKQTKCKAAKSEQRPEKGEQKLVSTPAKRSAVSTPVKPSAVSTPAKDSAVSTLTKCSAVSTPVKPSAVSTPLKRSAVSTPKYSTVSTPPKHSTVSTPQKCSAVSIPPKCSAVSTPVKCSKVSTPVKYSKVSTPVKYSAVSTPAKPSAVSSPAKHSTVSTPAKHSTVSTPSKRSTMSTPAKHSTLNTPVKRSALSTPPKYSAVITPTKDSAVSTPKYSTVSTPVKRSTVSTPAKRSTVSTPAKDSAVSTPAKRSTVSTPPKYSAVSTPTKYSAVSTPPKYSAVISPVKRSAVSTPVKRSTVSTPPKYSAVSTPAKYSAVSTPLTCSAVSTPLKCSTVSSPTKHSTVSTPAKRSAVSTPAKHSTVSTPAKRSAVSTPAKRSTVSSPAKHSTVSSPAKCSTVRTPAKHSIVSTSAKCSTVSTLAKCSKVSTPAKCSTLGAPTVKPLTMSMSMSKQAAVSTSTSKQTAVSTSTSKQTAVSTSTGKQTAVSTSTSKQTAVSTSTSKQTAVSTSTGKQTAVSTAIGKQTAVNMLAGKQTAVSVPTDKQTKSAMPSGKNTTSNTLTTEQISKCLRAIKQTAAKVSTTQQPAASLLTTEKNVANMSTVSSSESRLRTRHRRNSEQMKPRQQKSKQAALNKLKPISINSLTQSTAKNDETSIVWKKNFNLCKTSGQLSSPKMPRFSNKNDDHLPSNPLQFNYSELIQMVKTENSSLFNIFKQDASSSHSGHEVIEIPSNDDQIHTSPSCENGTIIKDVVKSETQVQSALCIPDACLTLQQNRGDLGQDACLPVIHDIGEAGQDLQLCQCLPFGPQGINTPLLPPLSYQGQYVQQPSHVSEVHMANLFLPMRALGNENQAAVLTTLDSNGLCRDHLSSENSYIEPNGFLESFKKFCVSDHLLCPESGTSSPVQIAWNGAPLMMFMLPEQV